MRLARLLTPNGPVTGQYKEGAVYGDDGSYEVGRDGELLSPCSPSAVYCIGRNYTETIEQMEYEHPDKPDFFIKPPTSLLSHGDTIPYPDFTDELTYAGELAAVIDKRCRNLTSAEVPGVIRGYTVLNDVDALDQQSRTARKAFDGSGPLGPWIETDANPTTIEMWTDINGERQQESNTNLMIFDPYEVVSFLSERITFYSGDVIAFGSPANPGLIEPGDKIEITYEGIGTLQNTVVESE